MSAAATRWPDVERVLDRVLDHPTDAWATIVEAECAGDPVLRREVESLLQQASALDGYLDEPAGCVTALLQAMQEEPVRAGERLGPWRLEEEVGRGGMGVVYRGDRADGLYTQTVAVKLLRADAAGAARRFAFERQVLAGLAHPGIARLLDGGLTEDGRPYLVMEYVKGEPLDAYCERRALSVEERLRLFLDVCDAVAYAHRHLVVHRDLKPGNIFVTEHEGPPRVKLLDFGIAKLMEPLGGRGGPALAALTQPLQRPFTPEYAAPEQVEGRAATTATDVYGLGVVLFELLAGRRPFLTDPAAPRALERAILEDAPPRPSVVGPEDRHRRLTGDLDAIVAKALRKEPEARYVTTNALAADLRRHLDGLPVEARRGAAGYRLRKFARRHRLGVGVAGAAFALALSAAVLFAVQARRLDHALTTAEGEGRRAEAVSGFLSDLIAAADPYAGGNAETPVRDLLSRGLARVDTLAGQPAAQAGVLLSIGKAYRGLGLFAEATPPLERALGVLERLHGPRHAAVAEAQVELADLAMYTGATTRSDSLYRAALATYRASPGPHGALLVRALIGLGTTRWSAAAFEESDSLLHEAVRTARAANLPPTETANALTRLARLQVVLGRAGEAERYYREAYALNRRTLGPDHPMTIVTLSGVGVALREQGRASYAESLQREAVERARRALGPDHPEAIAVTTRLAETLTRLDRNEEAAAILRDNVGHVAAVYGEAHPLYAIMLIRLGTALAKASDGDIREAEGLLTRGLALTEEMEMVDWPPAAAHNGLGNVHLTRGQPKQAEASFRQALALLEEGMEGWRWHRAEAESGLAVSLRMQRER